ncbi:MAG TPA: YdcF family protein [Xanthobacteraceae bacterium]|nr:YdcF family protein [Xanthobacteraceae bacterium]
MPDGDAKPADGATVTRGAAMRKGAFARAIAVVHYGILLGFFGGVLALGLGFLWFLHRVPTAETPADRSAEGIVVLTGGALRINDAVELLAAGRGRRLLITGVNPITHSRELARLTPQYRALFGCCIDLDHTAQNTIGNAVETRRWTRTRGFHSLLVVTSAYHMPRAIAELAHELPDVALIEFPVLTERQRAEPWWSNGATARLVISEYLKFVVAVVRMRVLPDRDDEGAMARRCCAPG